jgi:hypothetical protein
LPAHPSNAGKLGLFPSVPLLVVDGFQSGILPALRAHLCGLTPERSFLEPYISDLTYRIDTYYKV